ncbi:hypothetical protein [Alkalihalobacillus trypoxylicola]|nr:hypothetical protein [Alkalihalobacillus trypoxylicola]GAF65103.1 putative hydrolase [Bacillus sp. TS-2]
MVKQISEIVKLLQAQGVDASICKKPLYLIENQVSYESAVKLLHTIRR